MNTNQENTTPSGQPDINARLEKILADASDAIDDAITGAIDASDPITKTQILSEGYAKVLRLTLPSAEVDGMHLPSPGEVPAHVEQIAPMCAIHGGMDGVEAAPRNAAEETDAETKCHAHRSHLDVIKEDYGIQMSVYRTKREKRMVGVALTNHEEVVLWDVRDDKQGHVTVSRNGILVACFTLFSHKSRTESIACKIIRVFIDEGHRQVRRKKAKKARARAAAETGARPTLPEDDE